MKFKLIIVLFTLLFINACNFNEGENENNQTNSDSIVVNTTIKAIFSTEDSLSEKNISVSIIGKDAEHIFDVEGKTNYKVENGVLNLFLAPGVNPTNENPLTFTIQANMEGYLPIKQEVFVYNNTEKVSVNCIFKKPIILNKEQKKEATLIEKNKNKTDTKVNSNSPQVSTKAEVKKPTITTEEKNKPTPTEKKIVDVKAKVNPNSPQVSPKAEVKKPTITTEEKSKPTPTEKKIVDVKAKVNSPQISPKAEVKKPTITTEEKNKPTPTEKKIVDVKAKVNPDSPQVSLKAEVKKPTITSEEKNKPTPTEKKIVKIDSINFVVGSNIVKPKVEAQKPTVTVIKKEEIPAKKENIKTDTLGIIANSNSLLPKVDINKQKLNGKQKKDSINVTKKKDNIDTLTLNSRIDSDTFKIEKQNASLIAAQNKDTIPFNKKNLGISLGLGSIGYNLSLHHQFNKKFGVRLGYSRGYYDPQYYTVFSGNSINVVSDFNVEMLNFHLDYFPFKNKIFRISTGISRNFNTYLINITPLTNQTFGYISYPPESIGNLQVKVTVDEYNPYLGIGFGKTIPNTKLGMGVDLGLYYHSSPKFKLITKGSFEPSNNQKNISLLNNAFYDWVFFPMANLIIVYRIND